MGGNKWYAVIDSSYVNDTSLGESNGDLLVFNKLLPNKEMLVDKLESVYGVSEMAKRGTTVAKRKSLEKAITKDVEGLFKADSNRAIDSKLRATKAGKRKSKKYARIQRKDGSYFRRRNANQFGDAQGNQTYYEYRKNRTDKNVWLEDGGALPTSGGFVYNIGGLI
jgi:hypothetical protein